MNNPDLLALAALGGLIAGLGACDKSDAPASGSPSAKPAAEDTKPATAVDTAAAPADKPGSDCCAGKNDCKGKGGCKTDDHGCAGKNDCKGKGGCQHRDCA